MRLHKKLIMLSSLALALPAGAEEKTAFLGVKTAPVHPALAAQLELENDTGLTVGGVVEGSPAEAAGIQEHDILAALNDTPLTSPVQLRELVLTRQPGDEVELTLIRKAKSETVKLKLGELPEELAAGIGRPALKPFVFPGMPGGDPFGDLKKVDPRAAEMLDEMMKRADPDGVGGGFPFGGFGFGGALPEGFPDMPEGFAGSSHSSVSINDGEHQIELETRDGLTSLTAKTADGEVLYEGPYMTDEDKELVPEDIRKKVDNVKSGIRIGPGFRGLPELPGIPKGKDEEPIVPTQKRTI